MSAGLMAAAAVRPAPRLAGGDGARGRVGLRGGLEGEGDEGRATLGEIGLDGRVRLDAVEMALDVGEVVLEVGLRVDGRGVDDGEDVVERQVGVGDVVGAEEEGLVLEQGIEPFLRPEDVSRRRRKL